jgi:hypothetical protein
VPGTLTLDDGHDSALLDSRRALETVGVDTTEELSLQVHVVEGVGGLIVVGLNLACEMSVCARKISARRLQTPSAHRSGRRRAAQILQALTLSHVLETLVSHDCGCCCGRLLALPVVGESAGCVGVTEGP